MSDDVLTPEQRNIRGNDSNSLLRLYDRAKGIFTRSDSKQERARADKALQRIARELRRRNVEL